jgi:PAS domain S-box-containing protein
VQVHSAVIPRILTAACDLMGKLRRQGPFPGLKARTLCSWVLLTIPGIVLCMFTSPGSAAQQRARDVVVLSGGRGRASLNQMEAAVRTHVPWPVNFSVVDLENPRFEEKSYRESLAEALRRAYGEKPDLVIAVMDPSLRFAEQYRDNMFPGVPIVFMSVSTLLADQKREPGVTGVASMPGIRETIDLALRLHPDTNAVAVITNESETEKDYLAAVHSELLRHKDKLKEIDLIGPPSGQMLERIAALPPQTVALFQLIPHDSEQPAIGAFDVLDTAAEHLPTYSVFPSLAYDHGGIGGASYDATNDAVQAGEIAARVLSGERPDRIPIVHNSNLQIRVNWQALRRWNISESALPPGSVVLYREPTLWERYRRYVLAAISVIVAQALLIAGLLWQRARKRKAEAVLRESEERFRLLADATPAMIWMCDAEGKITYVNSRALAFSAPNPTAGHGAKWMGGIHPDDLPDMSKTIATALKTRQPFSYEYRLRRSDGAYRWMLDVALPRMNGDGSFAGFVGAAIDSTDQKLAQQALERVSGQLIEAQEKERRRIARELHDNICQRLGLLSLEIDQANRNSNGARMNLEDIGKHCDDIANEAQAISHQLHSSKLDYLGMVAALKSFCEEFSKQHHVDVEFIGRDVPENLSRDISLSLFRVTQEALNNSAKYSATGRFAVEVRGSAGEVRLEVRDWGKGFDVEEAKQNRGLGLVSMQERVNLVGGRFSIESNPGEGTIIKVVVPLPVEKESPAEAEAMRQVRIA